MYVIVIQFISSLISLQYERDSLYHEWHKLRMLRPSLESHLVASLHIDCNLTADDLLRVHNLDIYIETGHTHACLALTQEMNVVALQPRLQVRGIIACT